ncbi:MAG: cytidine deaminase [Rikenellaceae bacterium]
MSSGEFMKYNSIEQMVAEDIELINEARKALCKAHAPYSNFKVGAAVRLSSGRVVHGSNQESEVYPAGMCAERVVLFYTASEYANDLIESVAIASSPSQRECSPCGECRQVLLDMERRQGSPIRVIMSSESSATVAPSAESLLPLSFKL